MKLRVIALIASQLAAVSADAANGNIAPFFDIDAGAGCATVPCQCSIPIYIYGLLQGASAAGITGAEYKIRIGESDLPDPGWVFSESFDPAATVIGSAFTPADNLARGVNVAWPSCQPGDGANKVLIETVEVFNMGCSLAELQLLVVKHDRPSNQFFQCPMFVLCDAPVYTEVCLGSNLTQCRNPEPPNASNATCSTSGQAFLNPSPSRHCSDNPPPTPAPSCAPIAIEHRAWSHVKSLYRD